MNSLYGTTPAIRAAIAAVVTGGSLFYIKPISFFTPDGRPRLAKWAVSRPEQINEAVMVPWWGVALAVGLAVDLFV